MNNDDVAPPGMRLIGCAGWTLPKDAQAAFPAEGTHLQRYASVFPVAEINSSFHRPHRAQTYERWAASVPDGFRFSVKLPRTITHDARLCGVQALLDRFAGEAGALGHKLGCVLVQLPPKLAFDARVAEDFFARLQASFGCMVACEARHPSWFTDGATDLLRERAITRVIADPPAGQNGPHVPTTSTIYARLHGSPRVYYSSYPEEYLSALAADMAEHVAAGRTVWCIFDNTASGAAVPNALTLLHAQAGQALPGNAILPAW
ncbi:DUF72 domain-containing protein [Massilia agilis]|uniref:DUF72 domain-containing protein n=1 Tax=Massilia agilis TaxID=1811226 RepID=A0ABT2D972_9BURK|nr:DUF72 domain-containing protein [Massilia agilis]MCS0807845.1 DUF72 domain-containing protein [Massilia agilis]